MAERRFISVVISDAAPAAVLLRRLPDDLARNVLQGGLLDSADVVRQAVRAAAPKGTEPTRKTRTRFARGRGKRRGQRESVAYDYGHLQDNIRVVAAGRGGRGAAVRITTGKAFWGLFLEKGTVRMRARPFFFRAAEAAYPRFLVAFADALGRGLRAAVLRLGGGRFLP